MADSQKPQKRQRTTRASARASAGRASAGRAAAGRASAGRASAAAASSAKPGEPAFDESKPFLKMKKWTAVATWSWNVVTDTCAICRNNLHEPRCARAPALSVSLCVLCLTLAAALRSIDVQAMGTQQVETTHEGLSIAWGAPCHPPPHPPCARPPAASQGDL